MKKLLVAFDFDDTLINANSDLYIKKLIPNKTKIPDSITRLYTNTNWTRYMGAIFRFLHERGIGQEALLNCLEEISFVPGMKELLQFISAKNCDAIIISDANSIFINQMLKKEGLDKCVQSVFTNPACFDSNGCLQISEFHFQDWCDLSTVNLCKGHILENFLTDQKKNGTTYDTVAYVGDGSNDLCPSLRLTTKDLVFPRVGYRLLDKITSCCYPVQARVKPWNTGFEIMNELESLV